MFASNFVSVTNGFSDRQRQAAELLIAGVAFQQDGKTWNVFSHDGDEIGKMSTFVVCETSCMLKKAGLQVNNSPFYCNSPAGPNDKNTGVVTFAHNGFPNEEINKMMARRFLRPLTLM